MAVGLGAGIIAFVGGTTAAAVTATAIGSIVSGIVGGIVIGAAIGGISAAVTGGSIGKGILFGAIGGAVAGGISGYLAGAGALGTAGGTGGSISTGVSGNVGSISAEQAAANGLSTYTNSAGQLMATGGEAGGVYAIEGAAGGALEAGIAGTGRLSDSLVSAGVQGAFKLGEGILGGMAEEEAIEAQIKAQKEEAALNREHAMSMAEMNNEAAAANIPYNPWKEQLAQRQDEFNRNMAENKRQFDIPFEEAANSRNRASSAISGMANIRRGSLEGLPSTEESRVKTPQLDKEGQVVYDTEGEAYA